MLIALLRRGPGGLLLVVLLLVALALLASIASGPPRRSEPYEPPPPCRLVPGPAGAWSDAQCLRAPARHHQARIAERRGRPGAGS
jgi:hypothetical protein